MDEFCDSKSWRVASLYSTSLLLDTIPLHSDGIRDWGRVRDNRLLWQQVHTHDRDSVCQRGTIRNPFYYAELTRVFSDNRLTMVRLHIQSLCGSHLSFNRQAWHRIFLTSPQTAQSPPWRRRFHYGVNMAVPHRFLTQSQSTIVLRSCWPCSSNSCTSKRPSSGWITRNGGTLMSSLLFFLTLSPPFARSGEMSCPRFPSFGRVSWPSLTHRQFRNR
jgi:hypothetical protein